MNKLLLQLRVRLSNRAGMSLVEMSLVVVLMGILSVTIMAILLAIYSATSSTVDRNNQTASGEAATGLVASTITKAQPNGVGMVTAGLPARNYPGGTIPATPAGLLPTSLARDQIVYVSGGKCLRVFFVSATRTLWAAVADNCNLLTNAGFMRGPNQLPGSFPAASPVYDPVLDTLGSNGAVTANFVSYKLAEGVLPLTGAGFFTPRFIDGSAMAVSQTAALGSTNTFYSAPGWAAQQAVMGSVEMSFKALGNKVLAPSAQRVIDREFSQVLYLGQSCAP